MSIAAQCLKENFTMCQKLRFITIRKLAFSNTIFLSFNISVQSDVDKMITEIIFTIIISRQWYNNINVEDSCTKGDIRRVWLVRNKKTIYRAEKEKRIKDGKQNQEKIDEENKKDATSPNKMRYEKAPMTPPDRIYKELGNFASKNYDFFNTGTLRIPNFSGKVQKEKKESEPYSPENDFGALFDSQKDKARKGKLTTPNGEEVVEMVNKWRIGETPNTDRSANERGKEPLKKDNVAPEEVVEIIKNHRLEIKKLSDSASPVEITKTMKEWEKIYQDSGNEMEWEAINIVAVEEAQEEQQLEGEKELHK
ncbi:unnamed protein product [Rhizophagus irregularis]|nr:unnamed protein product [Rhizophagus irregularis]